MYYYYDDYAPLRVSATPTAMVTSKTVPGYRFHYDPYGFTKKAASAIRELGWRKGLATIRTLRRPLIQYYDPEGKLVGFSRRVTAPTALLHFDPTGKVLQIGGPSPVLAPSAAAPYIE